MDAIVARLEGLVARIAGGADDGEGTPVAVSEYDAFYTASVQPFVDACGKFEETKKLGDWTETSFKHTRTIIEASTQCKKPADDKMMGFLGPIVTVITDAQNQDNRSPFFPQQKSFGEAIQCLNFLLADGPPGLVMGQLDAADFYLSKCLTVAKDKEDPDKTSMRAFVSTLKAMLKGLAQYCKDFHKTGVMWKFSGVDISEFKAGEKAAGGGGTSSVEGRLEALCGALEAHAAKAGGGEDGPVCIGAYQEFYTASVVPFIETAKGVNEKCAAWTEKAFKHLAAVIKATTECKKPQPEDFMKFLGPIVEVITESGNPDNKSKTFNHEKAFFEMIQALNFVCMDGSPKGYIMGQIDAGSFYSNKILVAAKELDDDAKALHRAFVKQMKELLTALAAYAHEHFKMGLTWNVKEGVAIGDFKP